MKKVFVLLAMIASSLMGQFEFQCLPNADICIDVHTVDSSKKTVTYLGGQLNGVERDRYYPFVLNAESRLGAPSGAELMSKWSVDSDVLIGSDIVIRQLRYTKNKTTVTAKAAQISLQGEPNIFTRCDPTSSACGVGQYLSGNCGVAVADNKSLYITTTSGDPSFVELKISDRDQTSTNYCGNKTIVNCESCWTRIEWFIKADSAAERFFDKLFTGRAVSRFSIQIAASGQTPAYAQ